jgi:hypothetical protein
MYSKEVCFDSVFFKSFFFTIFFSVFYFGSLGVYAFDDPCWAMPKKSVRCCLEDTTRFVESCVGVKNKTFELERDFYSCAENNCGKYDNCLKAVRKCSITPVQAAEIISAKGIKGCNEKLETLSESAKEIEVDLARNSTANSTAATFTTSSLCPYAKPTTWADTIMSTPTTIKGLLVSTVVSALSNNKSTLDSAPTNTTYVHSSSGTYPADEHPTSVSATEMLRDTFAYATGLVTDAASTVYTDLYNGISTTIAAQDDDDENGYSQNIKIAIVAGFSALVLAGTICTVYCCHKQKKLCFKDLEATPTARYERAVDDDDGGDNVKLDMGE